MWDMYLAHIFTNASLLWDIKAGMRILCVCVWCVCVRTWPHEHSGQTNHIPLIYTECFATLPGADFPHFSVGSSFENHWRWFNARSPFQRSSLFQKGLWFSNLLDVSFNTSPIGKPNSIQRPLVQRLKRLCSAITQVVLEFGWNLVSLQVAVQTLLGQDDVNLTCFP